MRPSHEKTHCLQDLKYKFRNKREMQQECMRFKAQDPSLQCGYARLASSLCTFYQSLTSYKPSSTSNSPHVAAIPRTPATSKGTFDAAEIGPSDNLATALLQHPTRSVHLQQEIAMPHLAWSECHEVQYNRKKGVYSYREYQQVTKENFLDKFAIHHSIKQRLLTFKCIDQKVEGPCSLAAIAHLFQIYGRDYPYSGCFLTHYQRLGFAMDGYTNWTAFFNSASKLASNILEEQVITFVPLRHRRGYNKIICATPPNNHTEYNTAINEYLKSLLDKGRPFAVPFEGHFVVVVGYSKDDADGGGYLVINSFGNDTGFDGLWFIHPMVHEIYTQLNFCNDLTGIVLLQT